MGLVHTQTCHSRTNSRLHNNCRYLQPQSGQKMSKHYILLSNSEKLSILSTYSRVPSTFVEALLSPISNTQHSSLYPEINSHNSPLPMSNFRNKQPYLNVRNCGANGQIHQYETHFKHEPNIKDENKNVIDCFMNILNMIKLGILLK